jgi:hypothetical protein
MERLKVYIGSVGTYLFQLMSIKETNALFQFILTLISCIVGILTIVYTYKQIKKLK